MTQARNRILVLFAHPSIDRSEVNKELLAGAYAVADITIVDLYREYARLQIDIDREQQRLRDHDVIIFMFPLYWYSTPSLLKEWQDLVLEYGFAYGEEGDALRGKVFFCCLTAGGPETAYCSQGSNQYSLRELLRPLEQTANLCGMRFLAPFALYGARTALEEERIDCHVEEYTRLLTAIRDGQFDVEAAALLPQLNDQPDLLLRQPA